MAFISLWFILELLSNLPTIKKEIIVIIIAPVFKKNDKQSLKNYRPISLLPIFGKMFGRAIYNKMSQYFTANNLTWPNQSGFKPGDSSLNQLLSIPHEIFQSFDSGLEVRDVFLDISKVFDKVSHDGLTFNLSQYGIFGNLFQLFKSFS